MTSACYDNPSCYGGGSGGVIGHKNGSASMHFAPTSTEWESSDWPAGQWACLSFHIEGWGTSNGAIRFWRNGVLMGSRTGMDLRNVRGGEARIGQFEFNNYYNGNTSNQMYPPEASLAYTYEDNIHVTKGPQPISCESLGFSSGGGSTPTTGTQPPYFLP